MGTLAFICPASRQEVWTGIEMDPTTFTSLRGEHVRCPHCLQLHQLSEVRAWIAPENRTGILPDEGTAAA